MYLNSTTTSPSSTLERHHEPPLNQQIIVAGAGGGGGGNGHFDDQNGYRMVMRENSQQLSPISLPSEDQALFESSAKVQNGAQNKKLISSKKDQIEFVDPRANKFEWAYPLCGCCNDNEGIKWCLLSTLCPCYVAGRVAEAAGDNGIACCILECFCPFSCYFGALVRRKIRLQRNIIGSTLEDLVLTCCCRQCALVQQAREQTLPILQVVERT